jgi:uncharacterized protein (DUF1778 family)
MAPAKTEGRAMDEHEFAAALRRAGLTIPQERREIMREAVTRFHELLAVLDEPLAHEDEPATLPRYDLGVKR